MARRDGRSLICEDPIWTPGGVLAAAGEGSRPGGTHAIHSSLKAAPRLPSTAAWRASEGTPGPEAGRGAARWWPRVHIRSPIVPMAARTIDRIPHEGNCAGGCRYEPKFDGFRCVARTDEHHSVHLWSRRGTRLNEAFPEVAMAVFEQLPPETVMDGELVRWSTDGRLDFGALQRRHPAGRRCGDLARNEPCHYVVFDVLEAVGVDVRPRPLSERRQLLEQLLADVPGTSLVVLCPQLCDRGEASLWFELLTAQGIEGLVVKAAASAYREGKRDWWKVKHYRTTEAIIGGVTGSTSAPQTLILGRYSERGRLRVVGQTSVLPTSARQECGRLLRSAGDDHPWPAHFQAAWISGSWRIKERSQYMRVVPDVVAEIAVDSAAEHGRWRHSVRFMRIRADLTPEDVPGDLDVA